MYLSLFGILISLWIFCSQFGKKLLPLLMLESMIIFLVWGLLSFSLTTSWFLIGLILLVFMVLDSVMGLSLLVCSSRNSSGFLFTL